MNDDTEELVIKVTQGIFKGAFGQAAVHMVTEETVGHVVAEVFKEAAMAGGEALASPLLRVLLRLADSTSRKLDLTLREPFQTGSREALLALEVKCQTDGDFARQKERLNFADEKLAHAFNIALNLEKEQGTAYYICFLRGLISIRLGSPAFAREEFHKCLVFLEPQLLHIKEQRESFERTITDLPPWHPGGMQAEINLQKEISKLKKAEQSLRDTLNYCQAALAKAIGA